MSLAKYALVQQKADAMVAVTWAAEQEDPTAIAVHFDCDGQAHEEHERAWQLFQSNAYGVAVAPLPVADAADNAVKPATRRARVLSLPEAFYLLTTAKCLAAPASYGSYKQIYERFSRASSASHFQRHFVVQLHFRQLGWVLKSGLNYGSHYVLYRGAANEFHSEYIVYVKGLQEKLPWGVVQALTRVAADVKKTALVCDVACEELISNDGNETTGGDLPISNPKSTLTEGRYAIYGQRFHFTAVAIRFWDVAGADAQASEQQSHPHTQQIFAFQPQPVLKKKPRQKMKRPRSEKQ